MLTILFLGKFFTVEMKQLDIKTAMQNVVDLGGVIKRGVSSHPL
jgi:hypothetical protein